VSVEAELARSAGRTRQTLTYESLVATLGRTSWRDTVRVGAIDGLARLRDERALPLIERFTDTEHMLSTRRSAVAALGELGEDNRAIRERIEELLDPGDPYFTPEAMRSLVKLKDPAALGAIGRTFEHSIDGRVKRHAREAIRDLRKRETPDEVKRLADALDRLRDEHQTLRDELARIKTVVLPEGDGTKPARPASRPRGGSKPRGKAKASTKTNRRRSRGRS
jgi:aminopeptidase N